MGATRENAVLVTLKVYGISGTRYDKGVTREVEDAHSVVDAVKVYKRIFTKDDLSEVYGLEGKARTLHCRMTMPWYDGGPRLLAAKGFDDYTKVMNDVIQKHNEAVDRFIEFLDKKVEEARIRLNGLFNEADYPDPYSLKGRMRLQLRFDPLPDKDDFRLSVSDEVNKTLMKELEERKVELEKAAMDDLWGRLKEVLEHVFERLNDEDAKFRNTLTDKVNDLVKILPTMNICNDKNLTAIIKMTEKSLANLDPEGLREDKKFRSDKAKETKAILDKMANYY